MGEHTYQALDAVDRVHRNLTRAGNPSVPPLLCLEHLSHVANADPHISDVDDSGNPQIELLTALNMETSSVLSHHSFPREHPFYREHPPSPLTFVFGDDGAEVEEQSGTCRKPMIYICGKNEICPHMTMFQKNCGLDSSTTIWPSSIPEASASTIEESPKPEDSDVPCMCAGCSEVKSSDPSPITPRCHCITPPPKSTLNQLTRRALRTAPRRYIVSSDGTECDSTDGTPRECNRGSSNESSSEENNGTNGSLEGPSCMVYNIHSTEPPSVITRTNTQRQSSPAHQQRSSPQPMASDQPPKSILLKNSPQKQTPINRKCRETPGTSRRCHVSAPRDLPQPTQQSPKVENVPKCHSCGNAFNVWDSLAAEAQAVALAVSAVVPARMTSTPPATSTGQSEQTWNQIRSEALEVAKAVLNASGQVATNAFLGEQQTTQEQRNDLMWEQVRRDAEAVALAALNLGGHIPQSATVAHPPKITPVPVSYVPQYNTPILSEQQQMAPPHGWTPISPADQPQNNFVYWERVTTAPEPQAPCSEMEPSPLPCPPTAPCSMTLRANSPNMVSAFSPTPPPMQNFVLPPNLSPVAPSMPSPNVPSIPSPVVPPMPGLIAVPVPNPVAPSVSSPIVTSIPGPVVSSMPGPIVSSMPGPVVSSMPGPVVSSMPGPVVSSMPGPVVSSLPKPLAPPMLSPVPHTSLPGNWEQSVFTIPSSTIPSVSNPMYPTIPIPVVPPTADTVLRFPPSTTPDPVPQPRPDIDPPISSSEENSTRSLGEEPSRKMESCGSAKKCCQCSTNTGEWDEGIGQSKRSRDRAAVDVPEETRASLDSSWMESASEGEADLDQMLELDSSHSALPVVPPPVVTDAPVKHCKILGKSQSSDSGEERKRKCTSNANKPKDEPQSSDQPKKCLGVVETIQETDAELQENIESRKSADWLGALHVATSNTDQQASEKHAISLVTDPPSTNTETNPSAATYKGRSCRYNRRVRLTCSRPEFSTDAVTSCIQQQHYLNSLQLEPVENQDGPTGGISPRAWIPGVGNTVNRTFAVGYLFTSKTVLLQDSMETPKCIEDTSLRVEQRATQTEEPDKTDAENKSSCSFVRRSASAVERSSESESPSSSDSDSCVATPTPKSSSAPSASSPTRSPAPSASTSSSLSEQRSRPSAFALDSHQTSAKEQSETTAMRASMSTTQIGSAPASTPSQATVSPSASLPRVLFEPMAGTSSGTRLSNVFPPTTFADRTDALKSGNMLSRSFDIGSLATPENDPRDYTPPPLNATAETPITSKFSIPANEKKEVPRSEGCLKKNNFCSICSGIMLNLKAHLALISSAAEFAQMLVEDIGEGQGGKTASDKLIGLRSDMSEPRRRVGSFKAKRRLGQRRPPPRDSTSNQQPQSPADSSYPRLSERTSPDTTRLESDVLSAMQTIAKKLANTQQGEDSSIPSAEDKSPEDIVATEEDNTALSTRAIASASSSGSALCERRWVELRRLERTARRRRLREERDAAAASLARTLRASVHSHNPLLPPPLLPPPPPPTPSVLAPQVTEASDAGEDAGERSSELADHDIAAVDELSPASRTSCGAEPAPAVDADSPGVTGGPSQPASSSSSSCLHSSASATSLDTTTRVSHLESMESFRQRVAAVRVGDFTLPWATASNSSQGHPSVYIPRPVGLGGTRLSSPSTESLLDEPAIIQSIPSDEDIGKESDVLPKSVSGDLITRAPDPPLAEPIPSQKTSSPSHPPTHPSFRKSRSIYLHNSSSSESVSSLCRNNTSSPTTEREDTSQERSPSPLRKKKLFRVGNARGTKRNNIGGSLGQSNNGHCGHLSTIQEPCPVLQPLTKSSRSLQSDSGSRQSIRTATDTHNLCPENSQPPRKCSEDKIIKSESIPRNSKKGDVPSPSSSVPLESNGCERRAPISSSQRQMSDTSCGVGLHRASRPMSFSPKRPEVVVEVSSTRSASLSKVSRGSHAARAMTSQHKVQKSSSESPPDTNLGTFSSTENASRVKKEDPPHDPLRLSSSIIQSAHHGKVNRETIVRRSLSTTSRQLSSSPDRCLLKLRSPNRKTVVPQKSLVSLSASTNVEADSSKVRLVSKSKENNTDRTSSTKLSSITLNTRSNNNVTSVNVNQGNPREKHKPYTSISYTPTNMVSSPRVVGHCNNIGGEKDVKQDTQETGRSRILNSAGNVAYKLRESRIKSLIKEREEAAKQVCPKVSSRLSPLAVQYLTRSARHINSCKYNQRIHISETMEKRTTIASEHPVKSSGTALSGKDSGLKPRDSKELHTSHKTWQSRYETRISKPASSRNNKEKDVPRRAISSSGPSCSRNNCKAANVPQRPVSSSVLKKQTSDRSDRNISISPLSSGRKLPNSTKSCFDKFGISNKVEGIALQRHVSQKQKMTHINKVKLNFPDVEVMISHSASYTIRKDVVSKQQRPVAKSNERHPSLFSSHKENQSNNAKSIPKISSGIGHSLALNRDLRVSNEACETELKCSNIMGENKHLDSKSYTIQKTHNPRITGDPVPVLPSVSSCNDHRLPAPVENDNRDTKLPEGNEVNPEDTMDFQNSGDVAKICSLKNQISQEGLVEPSTPKISESQSPGSRHIFPFSNDSLTEVQSKENCSNSSYLEESGLLPEQVNMDSSSLEITPPQSPNRVGRKTLCRTASSPTSDGRPPSECLLYSMTHSTSSVPTMQRLRSPVYRPLMPPLQEDTAGSSAVPESYSVEVKTPLTNLKPLCTESSPSRMENDTYWPLSRAKSMPNRMQRKRRHSVTSFSPPRLSLDSTSPLFFLKKSTLMVLTPPPTPDRPSTPSITASEHLPGHPWEPRISLLSPTPTCSHHCSQPCSSRTSSPDRSEYFDAVESSTRTSQTFSSARFSTKLQKPS